MSLLAPGVGSRVNRRACTAQEVSTRGADLDVALLDKKIDQMMPELGFTAEDNDRLVASYRRACCRWLAPAPCISASTSCMLE